MKKSIFFLIVLSLSIIHQLFSQAPNTKQSNVQSDKIILDLQGICDLIEFQDYIKSNKIKEVLNKDLGFYGSQIKADSCKSLFYFALAYTFYDIADFQTSQPILIEALKLAEKIKNERYQCAIYNMIANLFAETGMFDSGTINFNRALNLALKLKDEDALCTIYGNYATHFYRYHENHKYFLDSARKYCSKTIELATKLNRIDDLHLVYQNIGLVESDCGNFELAEKAFRKSLQLCSNLQDSSLTYFSHYQLGRMFVLKGDKRSLDSALKYLVMARKDATRFNDNLVLTETLYELAMTYKLKKEYKLSSDYALRFAEFSDSLNQQLNSKETAELSEKYEASKKEAQIKELNLTQQEKQAQIDRQIYLIVGSVLILIFVMIIAVNLYRSNKLRKKSNEELNTKNKLIEFQKNEVEQQKQLVDIKNKEILDSIYYAKRIQYTLLASDKLLKNNLSDYFVLFKPKDIVSGDFYWAIKRNDNFYLAVCDCTGHGVPGAFMSLLNIGFLHEAIVEKNIEFPNEIFNYVRERLISSITQENQQDGMDGILLCMNEKTKVITYSAANNAVILIHDNQMTELPFDKMPVGKGEKRDSFKLYTIDYKSGSKLYLYTDGFADQFGGPKGKKFKYRQLNELLISSGISDFSHQKNQLELALKNWQNELEQVDDICIFGIRI